MLLGFIKRGLSDDLSINEFLQSLYDQRMIRFDPDAGAWQWDAATIHELAMSQIYDMIERGQVAMGMLWHVNRIDIGQNAKLPPHSTSLGRLPHEGQEPQAFCRWHVIKARPRRRLLPHACR